MTIDPRLYRAAYDVAVRVHEGTLASRNVPLRDIYPELVAEVARQCPGFSKADYEEAIARALDEAK